MKTKFSTKKCFYRLTSGVVALLLSQFIVIGSIHAASCPSGYLCFWDYEMNKKRGKVSGDNTNWAVFGWEDRADSFWNNGNTHNVCIYLGRNYSGLDRHIPRGKDFKAAGTIWEDSVSSNSWTKSSSCGWF